jgi:uncharacterized protein YjiS (DUF1127 family)
MSSLLIGCFPLEGRAAGASWWVRLARTIVDELRARRGMARMGVLDDRALGDVGLGRGGIEYAARFGRDWPA